MDTPGIGTAAAIADAVAKYLMHFLRTSTFSFRVFFDKIKALSTVSMRVSRCRCGKRLLGSAHQIDTRQDSGCLSKKILSDL